METLDIIFKILFIISGCFIFFIMWRFVVDANKSLERIEEFLKNMKNDNTNQPTAR